MSLLLHVLQPLRGRHVHWQARAFGAGQLADHAAGRHLEQHAQEGHAHLSHVFAFKSAVTHASHETQWLERESGALLSVEVVVDRISDQHRNDGGGHGESSFHAREIAMRVFEVLFLDFNHLSFLLLLVRWDVQVVVLQLLYSATEVPCLLLESLVLLLAVDVEVPDDFLKDEMGAANGDD